MQYINIDSENNKIYNNKGEFLCDFKYEEMPDYSSDGSLKAFSKKTGKIILYLGDITYRAKDWNDADSYLMKNGGEQLGLFEEKTLDVLVTGFQSGDQIKIKTSDEHLSKLLNIPKDKISKKAVVKNPNAPNNMLGVMIDGKYVLIDEEDAEIIYEGFTSLREMKYFKSSSGINIPISTEEDELLKKINDKLNVKQLDDREKRISEILVQKNILKRSKDSSGIFLSNTNQKLRRD